MTNVIKFEDLDIPALTLVAQEQYGQCLLAIDQALTKQLEFGRVLRIVRSKLAHGEWTAWVRETFADHKSLRTIQRHMRGAEAVATDPSLLECADSLDGILKIVEAPKPSVKVVERAASSPESSPATAEPKVREKSPDVHKIERTMLKMRGDKKRHPQLERLAQIALDYLGPERRTEVLTRQLLNLTPEALSDVFERLEAWQNELTKRQTAMSGNS